MSQLKPSLFFVPLVAFLLTGCTEENNYYVQNNPPEFGVTILYPTANDTVRVLMNGSAGDTVVMGTFRVDAQRSMFLIQRQLKWLGPEGLSDLTLYESEWDTVLTTEFEAPILVADFDTIGGEFESPTRAELLARVSTDTTGQGGGQLEPAELHFHITFVDTSQ